MDYPVYGEDHPPVRSSMEEYNICKYSSGTLDGSHTYIKKTIIELIWLDLEMEKYKFVFNLCNFESPHLEGISKLKKKCAELVMDYKCLFAKKYNGGQFVETSDTQELIAATNVETTNGTYFSKTLPFKEIDPQWKINYKRKREEKENDTQILKRSKILDDCIMRANAPRLYSVKYEAFSSTNNGTTVVENSKHHEKDEVVKDFQISSAGSEVCSIDKNTTSVEASPQVNPADEEIRQILSKLPPLEEALKASEIVDSKRPAYGNPTDTIHFDIEGRTLVILPYVDVDMH